MKLLALSGSLRIGSSNRALLEAAQQVAPRDIAVMLYDGLATLPHFSPDDHGAHGRALPSAVAVLHELVGDADGLLIACPEYAHGIPGAFKNALDWLVGCDAFAGIPVALLSNAARAVTVRLHLIEVLTTMAACVVPDASLLIPIADRQMTAHAIATDAACVGPLREAMQALARATPSPLRLRRAVYPTDPDRNS